MSAIRDLVLSSDDMDRQTLVVPEWGDASLELRSPNGDERAALALLFSSNDDETDEDAAERTARMYPALIAICAHDAETGERVFTDADVDALRKKNGAVVWRVGGACLKVAGMAADAVETAEKASGV